MKTAVDEEFDLNDDYFAQGEAADPPSMELVEIEQAFSEILDDPQAIRDLVRRKYVPAALMAYVDLLKSTDPRIKKAAADSILEIADVKGIQKGQLGGERTINFNLGGDAQKMLFGALGTLSQGTIMQVAEIVEEEND
jgi:hypothetical protein